MLARYGGGASNLAVGLHRFARALLLDAPELSLTSSRQVHTAADVDSKPLNLCNAINEALHIAMDSNDR